MKLSELRNLRPGLFLYNILAEEVARQHGLSSAGVRNLGDRILGAIHDRSLSTRDPLTSLRRAISEEPTAVVGLDDFNEWLEKIGSSDLRILEVRGVPPDESPPKESREARQDRRLKEFRANGGQPPAKPGGRWTGVTAEARRIGITRPSLVQDLAAALGREGRRGMFPGR